MMGRLNHDQEQFFYSFRLEDAVPEDHPVRDVAAVLDLSWVHSELAAFYPRLGRPSIDPVLMIRMLIVGYVFAIRSERALSRDVRVNLAYRWFCGLSIEDKIPDHSAFSRARNERFRDSDTLAKTEAFDQSRRDRKRVEMLFAHLKRIFRLGRLRLRGPCGAQFEFTLAAIAQNLRRLAKLVMRPPPIVAACFA